MNGISQSLRALLWSCIFIYVVLCSLRITQVDLWWQLSDGMHILRTLHLPTTPVVAYGMPSSPFFDEYAGYEVVLTCIYQLTGFPGLWMLFSAIYLMIIFLPSRHARGTDSRYDFCSCLALLIAGLIMRDRMEERPELVGSLLQVLLMLTLRKSKLETATWRTTIPFFLIFLAWTNTHSSFLLGLFTLFIWLACEIVLKYKSAPIPLLIKNSLRLAGVVLIALILNPYGFERLGFPFAQALDPGAFALSSEMWPIMNMASVTGALVIGAAGLIVLAAMTTRTTSSWLVLYSFFAVYMTARSFRCVSLLAIALLFVQADRDAQIKASPPRLLLLTALQGAFLTLCCLFMLFGDAYTFEITLDGMRQEKHFATHANPYAPEIVDNEEFGPIQRLPVLCGFEEGSYLSFERNKSFRPMLDSGMSHFSDDAKRYFFFIDREPEALDLALNALHANHVMINNRTFPWLMEMGRQPDWKIIACTSNGVLWQRVIGGADLSDPRARGEIEAARDTLLRSGDLPGAFCYSTLLGRPADSLKLFSDFSGTDWMDIFFSYFRAWVNTLPAPVIQDFLAHHDSGKNLIMDALLHERLGSDDFTQYAKQHSPDPRPWLWKVVQIEDDLARGDDEAAQKTFATISTAQFSSVTYYCLRQEIQARMPEAQKQGISRYGQWQTWDDSARRFVASVSAQLNAQIESRDELPGR